VHSRLITEVEDKSTRECGAEGRVGRSVGLAGGGELWPFGPPLPSRVVRAEEGGRERAGQADSVWAWADSG
jgi:hypothetical protein